MAKFKIKPEKKETMLAGEPAIQKSITITKRQYNDIVESGVLKYKSFSAHVLETLDKDLATRVQ